MYKFKAIKAGPLYSKKMSKLIRDRVKEFAAQEIVPAYDHVTDGWKGERPEWEAIYRAGATWFMMHVKPVDPDSRGALKWLWNDEGTKKHKIPKQPIPPGQPPLAFLSEYTPGSQPGSLYTQNAESGGDLVFARQVEHPGTKPRGWTKELEKLLQPKFTRFGEGVMFEVAKISGHMK